MLGGPIVSFGSWKYNDVLQSQTNPIITFVDIIECFSFLISASDTKKYHVTQNVCAAAVVYLMSISGSHGHEFCRKQCFDNPLEFNGYL